MRLWSIHPRYLDRIGLVALWREALLAQKVLNGNTKGYKNHPQLIRFKNRCALREEFAFYLYEIWKEARRRSYDFDRNKIGRVKKVSKIKVTERQLIHEFKWLCNKLKNRCPVTLNKLSRVKKIKPHPLFRVVQGDVENWEKVNQHKLKPGPSRPKCNGGSEGL